MYWFDEIYLMISVNAVAWSQFFDLNLTLSLSPSLLCVCGHALFNVSCVDVCSFIHINIEFIEAHPEEEETTLESLFTMFTIFLYLYYIYIYIYIWTYKAMWVTAGLLFTFCCQSSSGGKVWTWHRFLVRLYSLQSSFSRQLVLAILNVTVSVIKALFGVCYCTTFSNAHMNMLYTFTKHDLQGFKFSLKQLWGSIKKKIHLTHAFVCYLFNWESAL